MVVLVLSEDSCSWDGGGGGETQTGGSELAPGGRGGGTSPARARQDPNDAGRRGGTPLSPRPPCALVIHGPPATMLVLGGVDEDAGQRYLCAVRGVMNDSSLRLLRQKGQRQRRGWGEARARGDNEGGRRSEQHVDRGEERPRADLGRG